MNLLRVILPCLLTMGVQAASPYSFTRLLAHWEGYGKPAYLDFVADVQPQVAQVGFYGAHFYSLAHTPQFNGYPAHFPVRGLAECGNWFEDLNQKLHRLDAKVVGHFNVEFLIGDPDGPEGPRGFFKFYRELWDEKELGPKPTADPLDLLERAANGSPITNRSYAIGGMTEYWACLRNPAWQEVLKAWVRQGIRRGLDGFVSNYFYRHDCLCPHCQKAFREYLAGHFSADELRDRFNITNLQEYPFTEIVSWHDPSHSSPLRLEMLRFSQISNKEVFDKVFVRYGRSLKPDLILAQWNHLGDFGQISGDERCLLPAEQWGRDEDYLWYSTGGDANTTDLSNHILGEATLQARYIRGAFGDRSFTLGKYEATRIRTAIAELAANGGAPMGFYTRFDEPFARAEIVRYYQFLRRYQKLYDNNQPWAEALLFFPRRAVHQGNLAPLENFRRAGRFLLDRHVLFDVFPDDLQPGPPLSRYACTFTATNNLDLPPTLSRFEAPFSVRVSASRPANSNDEIDLHFVNYNRVEPPKEESAPSGIQYEKPIAEREVGADVIIPAGRKVRAVSILAPELAEEKPVSFKSSDGHLQFRLEEFLVYAVVRVQLQE